MDRDKRWDRTKIAYDLLTNGKGTKTKDFKISIKKNYDKGITDEFINPLIKVDENNSPIGKISSGDVVIFYNFRNDRVRQLTEVLSQSKNIESNMNPLNLLYITMTKYDEKFKNINVLFDKDDLVDVRLFQHIKSLIFLIKKSIKFFFYRFIFFIEIIH